MSRGDGTVLPWGSGPGIGKGIGRGGRSAGRIRGTTPGAGPGGDCVCPNCGARVSHQVKTPCHNLSCPKCGEKMLRG